MLTFIIEQYLVGIVAVVSVITYLSITTRKKGANVTSPAKPEVYDITERLLPQRRTEPQLQSTCTESLVKFGHVVSEISKRTDRQTDLSLIHISEPTRPY